MDQGEMLIRCGWGQKEGVMQDYHDREWGKPLHDEKRLFEALILDGMQAGLSWSTILHKRENFRKAFDGFDPERIACYDQEKIDGLLQDSGIIRNKLKVNAAVTNARAYLAMQAHTGGLDDFFWRYVDDKPIINHWADLSQVPASTPLSDNISKDMKKLGYQFVGTTIVYAIMQTIGMVNDHIEGCHFKYQ